MKEQLGANGYLKAPLNSPGNSTKIEKFWTITAFGTTSSIDKSKLERIF